MTLASVLATERRICVSASAWICPSSNSMSNSLCSFTQLTAVSLSVMYSSAACISPVTKTPRLVRSLLLSSTFVRTETTRPISGSVSGTTLSAVS